MQDTTTTCDRCGKVDTEGELANWSALWVQATMSTHLDICDECGKALLGWVQTGPPETEAEVAGPTPRDRTPGFA